MTFNAPPYNCVTIAARASLRGTNKLASHFPRLLKHLFYVEQLQTDPHYNLPNVHKIWTTVPGNNPMLLRDTNVNAVNPLTRGL